MSERLENRRMTVEEVATLLSGRVVGDGAGNITEVAPIESASSGQLTFLSDPRYARFLATTSAGAVLVAEELGSSPTSVPLIVVENPQEAFLQILPTFRPTHSPPAPGIDASANVSPDAQVDPTASIGPSVTIESGARVGARTSVAAGSFIGAGSVLGSDCMVHPCAVIYPSTLIGDRVVVGASSVIGSEGFGYAKSEEGAWTRVPQTGYVEVGDDVEIGSCVTIDRGTLAATVIGVGAKLDNQIHVAHNVKIGEHTVIAAQTGISGSTKIGPRNMIAGQVGIVGHIETAEDVIVEAQAGVSKSLVKPGRYFGHPAKEHSTALRQEGAIRQLPDLLREIRQMQRKISELEEQIAEMEHEVDQD